MQQQKLMITLTENQMQIAEDLGWNTPEMLTDGVKSLVIRIERAFANDFSVHDVTKQISPPITGAHKRKPLYAVGNQRVLSVTREYRKGVINFTSNYELFAASALLQSRMTELIEKLCGSDQIAVFSVVDSMSKRVIPTPQNIIGSSNSQNDIFICRQALAVRGKRSKELMDDLVKDYSKILLHAHRADNTIQTHFYYTAPSVLKKIIENNEYVNIAWEKGELKEYREVIIYPHDVPMYSKEVEETIETTINQE